MSAAPKEVEQVAIIGGGATPVALVSDLVENLQQRRRPRYVDITVHEPRAEIGLGLAYGTTDPEHILNMPAGDMSILTGDPLDFQRWLASDEPFPARAVYGRYLHERFGDACTAGGRSGIRVRVRHEPVTSCRPSNGGFVLTTSSGRSWADDVVVCIGNPPRRRDTDVEVTPGWFASPYEDELHAAIDPMARVLVLGSRLSAVDAVRSFARSGHRGPILLASRRSGLPRVQGPPDQHMLRHLDPRWLEPLRPGDKRLSLGQVCDWIVRELSAAGVDLAEPATSPGSDAEAFARYLRDDGAAYAVLAAIGDVSSPIWQRMSDDARHEFLDSAYGTWVSYRHRIPRASAAVVDEMLRSGRLKSRTGLREVRCAGTGFVADFVGDRVWLADVVIDARGPEHDIDRLNSPLLDQLRRDGHVLAHPFGGVRVDPTTHQLIGRAGPTSGLYFVGPLTRGEHFYTNSIHSMRAHAGEAAARLAKRIQARSPFVAESAHRVPRAGRDAS